MRYVTHLHNLKMRSTISAFSMNAILRVVATQGMDAKADIN